MPDSMESEPKKSVSVTPLFPRPRSMGSFAILITILAFTAGWIRNELALFLLGTIFLIILAYCFSGVFLLGITNRRKGRSLLMTIACETVSVGGEGELIITKASGVASRKIHFWRLPAILVRCELCLETKDGRVIRHFADPRTESRSFFPVRERGAYCSFSEPQDKGFRESERLVFFDAPGFFHLAIPIRQDVKVRLLALPHPAAEAIPLSLRQGGAEERNEPHYRKSDELIDNRPYVPGDDPRRINWKLYSHAPLGELFVREGESEPPPRSRIVMLIDTEADTSLYSPNEAREAVDALCENALAAAMEFSARGLDLHIGYTGGKISGGSDEGAPLNSSQFAAALAWPAAVFWPGSTSELPGVPPDKSVLILALPRTFCGQSALDRFLKNRDPRQGTDIVFLHSAECKRELEEAAVLCVNQYGHRPGLHAARAAVGGKG